MPGQWDEDNHKTKSSGNGEERVGDLVHGSEGEERSRNERGNGARPGSGALSFIAESPIVTRRLVN